jgi:hypothetical protein
MSTAATATVTPDILSHVWIETELSLECLLSNKQYLY